MLNLISRQNNFFALEFFQNSYIFCSPLSQTVFIRGSNTRTHSFRDGPSNRRCYVSTMWNSKAAHFIFIFSVRSKSNIIDLFFYVANHFFQNETRLPWNILKMTTINQTGHRNDDYCLAKPTITRHLDEICGSCVALKISFELSWGNTKSIAYCTMEKS